MNPVDFLIARWGASVLLKQCADRERLGHAHHRVHVLDWGLHPGFAQGIADAVCDGVVFVIDSGTGDIKDHEVDRHHSLL